MQRINPVSLSFPVLITWLFFGYGAAVAPVWAAEEYLPLTKGMEWVMNLEATSPNGDKTNGVAHRRIEGLTEQDGKTYFRSHVWIEGPGFIGFDYTKLVRKSGDGFYSIDVSDPQLREQKEIVLPLKLGNKWKWKRGTTTMVNEVVGQEDVTIGKKTYRKCFRVKVSSESGDYVEEFWEAPTVGNVKAEIQTGGGRMSLTLRELKPAPKE
jgi:hypothetical protein